MNTVKKRRFLSWKTKGRCSISNREWKNETSVEGSDSSKNRAVLQVLQKHREE